VSAQIMVSETIRLEMAVDHALNEAGCVHRVRSGTTDNAVPVPLEAAHFDPRRGLLWVKLHTERFPRTHPAERLLDGDFADTVSSHFGEPVVVTQRGAYLIVMSLSSVAQPRKVPIPAAA
jgi:hypothetical protein